MIQVVHPTDVEIWHRMATGHVCFWCENQVGVLGTSHTSWMTYVDTPKHTHGTHLAWEYWLQTLGPFEFLSPCAARVFILGKTISLLPSSHYWRPIRWERSAPPAAWLEAAGRAKAGCGCAAPWCRRLPAGAAKFILEEWRRSSSNPLHVYHVLQDRLWHIYIFIYISIQI